MGFSAATITAMQAVSAATATIGLAASVYGSYQQSKARKGEMKFKAAVENNKTIISQRQAADAIKRGKVEQDQHRQKVAALKGKQRSVLAGSGFQVNEDDALDILADTAEAGELDALTIKNNAARTAWGHTVQASNASAQAGLYRSQGDAENPIFSAGTTLFSGVGSVGDKWSYLKKMPAS